MSGGGGKSGRDEGSAVTKLVLWVCDDGGSEGGVLYGGRGDGSAH